MLMLLSASRWRFAADIGQYQCLVAAAEPPQRRFRSDDFMRVDATGEPITKIGLFERYQRFH